MNLYLITLTILVLICIVYFLLIRTLRQRNIYYFYSLRDELAFLVFSGEIDQKSNEYKFLIYAINNKIVFYDNAYTLFSHFKVLMHRSENPEIYEEFESFITRIETNEFLKPIIDRLFSFKRRRYFYKIRIYNSFIYLFLKVLKFFARILEQNDKHKSINEYEHAYAIEEKMTEQLYRRFA